jgi:hypothetical protein
MTSIKAIQGWFARFSDKTRPAEAERSRTVVPSNAPTRLRQLWSRYGALSIGFAAYLVITVAAYCLFPPAKTDGTRDGIVIALVANAIFAVTVGLVSAIVAVVKPEDQVFESRLWFLYPDSHSLTQTAWSALKESAMRLAAPAIKAAIHVTITECELGERAAFKLTIAIRMTIRNILRNEPYEDTYEVMVKPDDVGKERLGNVTFVQFRCNGHEHEHYREVPIERTDKRFIGPFSIKIPKAMDGDIAYEYWAWAQSEAPWKWTFKRYTENLEFKIKNNCSHAVSFAFELLSGRNVTSKETLLEGTMQRGGDPKERRNISVKAGIQTLSLTLRPSS